MRLRSTSALALLAVPAIALSACGGKGSSSDSSSSGSSSSASSSASAASTPSIPPVTAAPAGAIDGVTVAGTADKPQVKLDKKPFTTDKTTVKVLSPGSGATIGKQDTVKADVQILSGKTGTVLEDTFSAGRSEALPLASTLPGLADGIVGQKPGARVLVAMAPKDAGALVAASSGGKVAADESLLAVVRVRSVVPSEATGTPVAPKAGLPTVQFNHGKAATITVPKTPAPKSLVVQPLVQGNGPAVKAAQTVSVTYTGALYDGGKKFDSSFDHGGAPYSTVIGKGQVIPAWDKALVGAKVGSRLLIVAPPADGYGAKGSAPTIPANAPLVFVVDVLDAQ